MHDSRHTFDSALTCLRVSARRSKRPHGRHWAEFISGRSRQLKGVIFLDTLESPRSVNTRTWDILKQSRISSQNRPLKSFYSGTFSFSSKIGNSETGRNHAPSGSHTRSTRSTKSKECQRKRDDISTSELKSANQDNDMTIRSQPIRTTIGRSEEQFSVSTKS